MGRPGQAEIAVSCPFTFVYTERVEGSFRFDDRSYDALHAAGVSWQDVIDVLRTRPHVRHHVGAVLRIAGRTSNGAWLAIACIEEDDDEYLIVSARELDNEEKTTVRAMIKGVPT